MNYAAEIDAVLEQYKGLKEPLLGLGRASDEWMYLINEREAYVRTLRDVQTIWEKENKNKRLLEIGSFLGVVSLALQRQGFEVCAADIPEFHRSASLQAVYARNQVDFQPVNLRTNPLPYPAEHFDGILLCEVMEHFNFNPLPALQEINRVLRPNGYVYVAMPNQSSLPNRLKLLTGHSIRNPIHDFFRQMDSAQNMLVGLHWREYTLSETVEIFSAMGFAPQKTSYFYHRGAGWKALLKRLAFAYPPFRPFYAVLLKKKTQPKIELWRTEANS